MYMYNILYVYICIQYMYNILCNICIIYYVIYTQYIIYNIILYNIIYMYYIYVCVCVCVF